MKDDMDPHRAGWVDGSLRDDRDRTAELLTSAARSYANARGVQNGLCPTPIDGFAIVQLSQPMMPMRQIYHPSLCMVIQGAKQLVHGADRLEYGAMECLVVNVKVPATGRVIQASRERPYIGLVIDIDVNVLCDVAKDLSERPEPPASGDRSMFVSQVSAPLADCMRRLIRLCEMPEGIAVLHPLLMREIYYWLLTGPDGGALYRLALPESNLEKIARAIRQLHAGFAQRLPIEELAATAGMGLTSFHQHFKVLTSMTPLQFQKQLRLLEARRLMLAEALTVSEAAYQVGYESSSQFSRDYARMFGDAPKRDVLQQQRLLLQLQQQDVSGARQEHHQAACVEMP